MNYQQPYGAPSASYPSYQVPQGGGYPPQGQPGVPYPVSEYQQIGQVKMPEPFQSTTTTPYSSYQASSAVYPGQPSSGYPQPTSGYPSGSAVGYAVSGYPGASNPQAAGTGYCQPGPGYPSSASGYPGTNAGFVQQPQNTPFPGGSGYGSVQPTAPPASAHDFNRGTAPAMGSSGYPPAAGGFPPSAGAYPSSAAGYPGNPPGYSSRPGGY